MATVNSSSDILGDTIAGPVECECDRMLEVSDGDSDQVFCR
jgi:hypothetical protein